MRTKARGGWGGRRSLRRDRTGVGLVAQPGVTVQLAPNSRAAAAEYATSETIFLLSFALSHPRPHTQAVPGQRQGGKQTPSALHSNTQHRKHPGQGEEQPLGNAGAQDTPPQRGQKRQQKAPLQIHEKAPGAAVPQARDTVQGSSGSGSVVHSVLTSPLMQGVGVSQPQEQLQERCWHREGSHGALGSGFPWQLCSPAPHNLIPVHHIPAGTPQPELSVFHSNTIPGRFSWFTNS